MSQVESTLKLHLQGIIKIEVELETVTGLLIASGRGTARIGGADIEHVSVERTYICPPESSNESSSATQAATSSSGQTVQGQTSSTQQTGGANVTQTKREEIRVRVPYIPGSSLKGRIRSLLEVALGLPLYSSDGKIWAHIPAKNSLKTLDFQAEGGQAAEPPSGHERVGRLTLEEILSILVGSSAAPGNQGGQASQAGHNVVGRDAQLFNYLFGMPSIHLDELREEFRKKHKNSNADELNRFADLANKFINSAVPTLLLVDDLFPDERYVCGIHEENGIVTFEDFVEDKNENRIDRITSAADPRTIVRVKPGVPFRGMLSILVFDRNKNDIADYLKLLLRGMKLLELTYLGASGSRGYGRVRFTKIKTSFVDVRSLKDEQEATVKQSGQVLEYESIDKFLEEMSKDKDSILKRLGIKNE